MAELKAVKIKDIRQKGKEIHFVPLLGGDRGG
jgi:hypothetical protein